jgi:hypothetical protein
MLSSRLQQSVRKQIDRCERWDVHLAVTERNVLKTKLPGFSPQANVLSDEYQGTCLGGSFRNRKAVP